jgi:CMP/dCMP kinase
MGLAKIIAIDGPAGSGKSTLGERLANCLGFLYFDTGVMYRAVTWAALEKGINLENETEVTSLAEKIDIDVRPPSKMDGRSYDVIVNRQDITWEIRLKEIDANVSVVSAYGGVRRALAAPQRCIGLRGGVVMVGRDIGTVVLPEADLKIYLDASVEERARRRHAELVQRGEPAVKEEVLKLMKARDRIDSTRQVAPLKPAADAVILNSNGLDADQVLSRVKILLEEDKFGCET